MFLFVSNIVMVLIILFNLFNKIFLNELCPIRMSLHLYGYEPVSIEKVYLHMSNKSKQNHLQRLAISILKCSSLVSTGCAESCRFSRNSSSAGSCWASSSGQNPDPAAPPTGTSGTALFETRPYCWVHQREEKPERSQRVPERGLHCNEIRFSLGTFFTQ